MLVFLYFMSYLANKAQKHRPRSRIWVLPRSSEAVGKSESWLQPVPSELHSSRARASNFPDEASVELIPNPPFSSRVSWIKSGAANMGQSFPRCVCGVMWLEFTSLFPFFCLTRALTGPADFKGDPVWRLNHTYIFTQCAGVEELNCFGKTSVILLSLWCVMRVHISIKEWRDGHPPLQHVDS